MVKKGIVFIHHISKKAIEVDRANVEIIERFPPPFSVKSVRSFLGDVGLYQRFIKTFLKIAHTLCKLL